MMTAAQKLETAVKAASNSQIVDIYKGLLQKGEADPTLRSATFTVLLAVEREMDDRGLDVDGIMFETIGR